MAGVYGRNYLCNSKCIHCLCLCVWKKLTCTVDNIIILIAKHIPEQPILLERCTRLFYRRCLSSLMDKALCINRVWLARLTTRLRRHLASNDNNSSQWHIFITLIVSCTNTTVTPRNLNFISSAGMEVYSIPSKFQTDCSCQS